MGQQIHQPQKVIGDKLNDVSFLQFTLATSFFLLFFSKWFHSQVKRLGKFSIYLFPTLQINLSNNKKPQYLKFKTLVFFFGGGGGNKTLVFLFLTKKMSHVQKSYPSHLKIKLVITKFSKPITEITIWLPMLHNSQLLEPQEMRFVFFFFFVSKCF